MADNYSQIDSQLSNEFTTNGTGDITGADAYAVLTDAFALVYDDLNNNMGYWFAGRAAAATNPGTPTRNTFYFTANPTGAAVTYTNFAGLVVPAGDLGFLYWDGAWHYSKLLNVGDLKTSAVDIGNNSIDTFKVLKFNGRSAIRYNNGTNEIEVSHNDGSTWGKIDAAVGGGDVDGPASAVSGNLAAFDGTTGKIIKDSGVDANTYSVLPKVYKFYFDALSPATKPISAKVMVKCIALVCAVGGTIYVETATSAQDIYPTTTHSANDVIIISDPLLFAASGNLIFGGNAEFYYSYEIMEGYIL